MSPTSDHLQMLYQVLQTDEDWDAEMSLSAGTEAIPFEHLFIQFNADSEIDEHTLVISVLNRGPLQQSFRLEKIGDLLQVVSPFPYEIEASKVLEVNRLLALLNKILVVGCFGYDEREKGCYYRFTYPLMTSSLDYDYIGVVIRLVCEVIDTYAPTIEQVSAGVTTVDALLSQPDTGI